ncbi:DNA methyltransferase [Bosea sp. Leaf344]|uniref:site-specific DNA-methyltransferase n=1 Tax=Bosea sp. Leaf344 TaxID=1736346 RepID=UPI0009E6D49B|nr:DNA methyltransferase [Bosea sp. Leaf344]
MTDTGVQPGLPRHLQLKVIERPIDEIRPSDRNARTHSDSQITKIVASMVRFGFTNPIAVDINDEIVAGHGRYAAAKRMGLQTVPVIVLDHLNPAEIRGLRIADNRLAEAAGWDPDLLRLELGHLIEIDFEIDLTGFETPEIDILLNGAETESVTKTDPADEVGPVAERAVSRRGDRWLLDNHRLFCGDAREPADYERLLGGEFAQMTFTDPPYNLAANSVGGLGEFKPRPFAMASGEMSKPEFTGFLTQALEGIRGASQDGALVYTCMDGAHLHELLTAGHSVYAELKTVICWAKTNAGMGSLYRSQTEFVVLWKVGKAAHINNIELGKHGRYRTTLWTYAGANTFRKGRMEDLAAHPTVKPCVMVMDAIKDCSKPNGIILDPFGGSGTTLIAAHKTKRRGYLMEYDPLYVDVAIRRWEKLFKREARHSETGLTFSEMAAFRRGDAVATEAASEGGSDVD